jgi:hypothetical protein
MSFPSKQLNRKWLWSFLGAFFVYFCIYRLSARRVVLRSNLSEQKSLFAPVFSGAMLPTTPEVTQGFALGEAILDSWNEYAPETLNYAQGGKVVYRVSGVGVGACPRFAGGICRTRSWLLFEIFAMRR